MDTTTLSVLAEPNRMNIVELLLQRPCTVGEIADHLEIRQPQASKHLKVLSKAGIVEARADANWRIYNFRPEPFRELDEWLAACRKLWEERFDRLDDYLQELQTQASSNQINE